MIWPGRQSQLADVFTNQEILTSARDFLDGLTNLDNRGTPDRFEYPLPKPTCGSSDRG